MEEAAGSLLNISYCSQCPADNVNMIFLPKPVETVDEGSRICGGSHFFKVVDFAFQERAVATVLKQSGGI